MKIYTLHETEKKNHSMKYYVIYFIYDGTAENYSTDVY